MTPMSPRYLKPSELGFTLVELLVVLAIMALGAMLLAGRPSGNDAAASLQTKSELRATISDRRASAITTATKTALPLKALGYQLKPAIGQNITAVEFWPDGSSNGGNVLDSKRNIVLHIDWKTGRIDDPD